MLLHQHPQTAELTSRCYFARAVRKRDRQSGDNIPCERGFANHASASATLPALQPMSTSGGSTGTATLERASAVSLMGFFNTIPGSEKPIGILSRHLLIAGRIGVFHRFAAMIRSWLRGEMNMPGAHRSFQSSADDHFKVSVGSSDPIITAARASLKARDEISPKTRRPRHYGVELPRLLSPYGENK
jgi:hypothetical protein